VNASRNWRTHRWLRTISTIGKPPVAHGRKPEGAHRSAKRRQQCLFLRCASAPPAARQK
jgi:hypothetical protein